MAAKSEVTHEEKLDALRRIAAGETTPAEVATRFGVSQSAVYAWRKKLGAEAATEKPKRTKAEKPAKRKAAKKRAPKVETVAPELDAYAVADAWSLPFPLAQIVHGVRLLVDADDFDALTSVETAIAKHREQMEARAA